MLLHHVALLMLLAAAPTTPWQSLGKGLELATFNSPSPSTHSDSKITVLRIDPAKAHFTLLSASEQHVDPMTARQWAAKHHLRAVINAGMFGGNRLPVGYMRHGKVEINPKWSKDNALFAFTPVTSTLAPAQVIDRGCADAPDAKQYDSVFQGIRMIDCGGRVTWAKQPRQWSLAVMGQDRRGRILFIHSRSPYPVRRFAEILQLLPLEVKTLMYLEGGPEATLYVHGNAVEKELVGSYETGFFESDDNHEAWVLPNVVGVLEE